MMYCINPRHNDVVTEIYDDDNYEGMQTQFKEENLSSNF